MLSGSLKSVGLVLLFLIVCASMTHLIVRASGSSGAGAVIVSQADASYQDETGAVYSIVSPVVTITVVAVAGVTVTPDETASSNTVAPRETITRLFTICNAGNTSDSFSITSAGVSAPATLTALYFDVDGSGSVSSVDIPVQLNTTVSPAVNSGACTGALAVVETNDAAARSAITITLVARSNTPDSVAGQKQDSGTIINSAGSGARLTDPNDPNLPPSQLVNGARQSVVTPGGQLTYVITFRNSGDTPARDVVIRDQLPAGLEYQASSLQLDGRSLSDAVDADEGSVSNGAIEVRLPSVDPAQLVRLQLEARLAQKIPPGTGIASPVSITSANAAGVTAAPALAIVDPLGLVFAGRSGTSTPIAGAIIDIFRTATGEDLLQLPQGIGFAPNANNENPFLTDGEGHFAFTPAAEQMGNDNTAATYFMRIRAAGFSTRLLQLDLQPTHSSLFALAIHALDGAAVTDGGSLTLVQKDVRINDLAAVALNIPMFEPAGLQITKSADRARAEIGDAITYRIEVHNPTSGTIKDVVVEDHLPPSFHYAEDSAVVSADSATAQPKTPVMRADGMSFGLGDIAAGGTVRLLYRVRVGVNAREGNQENLAIASGTFGSGERTQTNPARATVLISSGVFSTRQIIVGRVFVDTNNNGGFDESDRAAPGIRLYLSNGQSAITDSAGLYNFPSLGDGPQVISLDPMTVPAGYALATSGRMSDRGWSRLLRTPVGGGGLLRQNFALVKRAQSLNKTENGVTDKPLAFTGNASTNKPSTEVSKLTSTPGTYEVAATDDLAAVREGDVFILSPLPNSVPMSPAFEVQARVALDWTARLEINGQVVSEKNIGIRSLDHKNRVSTFNFVGLNLKPGPNKIRCTAISPNGMAGNSQEITVIGRGPARRLEILTEKTQIQAGGNDSTVVRVKAFDEWGHPALDGEVGVETTAGQVLQSLNAGIENSISPASTFGDAAHPANQKQLLVQLKDGEAVLKLISSGTPGEARLRAQTGRLEAETEVRIVSEMRPAILVGLAELSFGQSVPEVGLRNEQGNFRSRVSFFYSGRLFQDSLLTLSYDSQRPINRTAGRDRLFQLDPLDRAYPLFGDSSTRFEAAESNSKVYARLDHKRSYIMFGDFETDMQAPLAGYARKLTGVKAHLENSRGDFVTVSGARPDTAFARDVFAAGALGLLQLSNAEILGGSEVVTLEIRDRRNPEVVLSREVLARSIDYSLDPVNGQIFFLRYISTFDDILNLKQIVVTYEHRATGFSSSIYTARARRNFKHLGLKLGLSAVMQRQPDNRNFLLGGVDAEETLPAKGLLQFAWAGSSGQVAGAGNYLYGDAEANSGNAFQAELKQPLPFRSAIVHAHYLNVSAGFFNPFGGTVTPGSQRVDVTMEMKPVARSTLRFGAASERNHTANVNNSRITLSAAWDQMLNDHIRMHFGFDRRAFSDELDGKSTNSNLFTLGAEVKATDKLQFSVKREQNLGEADPTYPTQTTLGATYQLSAVTKLFFTQRLAAAPIVPIGDFSNNGFAGSSSRRETAVGVESRFGKYASMTGRYQLENAINGTDSFAVIGLQDRLPITKEFSLELGFERGFHLLGPNQSFNSATVGFGWQPNSDFRASARYEYRDRGGIGQLLAVGGAGRLREGVTALSRFQFSKGSFNGSTNVAVEGTAALAFRPLDSDKSGLLFSYTHRSLNQSSVTGGAARRDRADSVAADGYEQLTKRLELYGRFALRFNANGQSDLPYVSTLTFLTQGRAQYLLTKRLDWALESRLLFQPSTGTTRAVYATEAGFWAIADLRLGLGYNFTSAREPQGSQPEGTRRGFYFTISSQLSNLFDLFGTSREGLAPAPSHSNEVTKPQP